ncbi:hypothetical protein BO78DRAFT_386152 [Aspergillus sclerotiicarbonarius CBS 121057]|uniref:GPI anchored protein n=1 Tax=Aspergillus sclerotiicarbonarius (strain CBS 121057 / IBT 28362) TaxID=1448318 RepID=A0A319EY50_ASPSB|nr:hypothetical protein BO78DRAFT_386152 [Aspergillus sclerotiicarbonarius CBS 121057]
MKFSTVISSIICLAASQLVAADIDTTSTSTVTTYITQTLVHVDKVTPTSSVVPSTSSVPVIPTSHAISSSIRVASSSSVAASSSALASSVTVSSSVSSGAADSVSSTPVVKHSGAGSMNAQMPIALVAGSLALILGAL